MLRFELGSDLLLRNFTENDAPEMFRLVDRNRAWLRKWLPWLDVNQSEADSLKFIRHVEEQRQRKESLTFGIFSDEVLVGTIGYHAIIWSNRRTSIGYWISEDSTGKGIIMRSTAFLARYALNDLNLHRVEIQCATENLASRRVPERLGFTHEGTLRENEWLYDHFVTHEVYALLKTDPAASKL